MRDPERPRPEQVLLAELLEAELLVVSSYERAVEHLSRLDHREMVRDIHSAHFGAVHLLRTHLPRSASFARTAGPRWHREGKAGDAGVDTVSVLRRREAVLAAAYEAALAEPGLSPSVCRLLSTLLMPAVERHARVLDDALAQAEPLRSYALG